VTSVPEITRMLARIQEWHGQAGGRADPARRLDEAHKLLGEAANVSHRMTARPVPQSHWRSYGTEFAMAPYRRNRWRLPPAG
jgi:hypothetical protein